jgi:hypothetical protein
LRVKNLIFYTKHPYKYITVYIKGGEDKSQ